MPTSIFAGDVAAALQELDNRYAVCHGLFSRARQINRQPRAEGETAPNPSAVALAEYSESRLRAAAQAGGK